MVCFRSLEPVEVHYHVHAVVYKALVLNGEWPSREELVDLLGYLRAFTNHGVAKPQGGSLFKILPEMHSLGLKMVLDASHEAFEGCEDLDVKETVSFE